MLNLDIGPVLVSIGNEIADFCGVVNLNRSAGVLWKTLQGSATRGELVQVFTDTFEVSEETARRDIRETLKMLMKRGLVSHVEE